MKQLESGSVDEYYQTINTWIRIVDEKNKSMDKMRSSEDTRPMTSNNQPTKNENPGQTRRKFVPK